MSQTETPTRAEPASLPVMEERPFPPAPAGHRPFRSRSGPSSHTRNGERDEAGIALAQRIGRKAQPVHGAGGKVLDEDVRLVDHAASKAASLGRLEIEADGFLAPVQPDEIGALPMHQMVIERRNPPPAAPP